MVAPVAASQTAEIQRQQLEQAQRQAAEQSKQAAEKAKQAETASRVETNGDKGTAAVEFNQAPQRTLTDEQTVSYRENPDIKKLDSRTIEVADGNGNLVKQEENLYQNTKTGEKFTSTTDINKPTAAETLKANELNERNMQVAMTVIPMILSQANQA